MGFSLPDFVVPGIRHYEAVRDEIIRLLQQERERRKLSNYAVAQRSGVSESMLSLVERGLRNPSLELALRIADGIGADLPALIKKAESKVVTSSGKRAGKLPPTVGSSFLTREIPRKPLTPGTPATGG